MNESTIAYCSIFPKLGIARVGNSDEWFVGPEAPGVPSEPQGGFKDEHGRVKRQAARFRIYGFNADNQVVGEITSDSGASVKWRVSLANKKAGWYEFHGGQHALELFEGRKTTTAAYMRNSEWPGDPRELVIKSNSEVNGISQTSAPLLGAIYQLPDPVYLGELRTDGSGRLMVLGGRGHSQAVNASEDYLITNYANNDCWHDDVSDGPVEAEVTLGDGTTVEVRGRAWVIVTPPDFSPYTQNLTTLFDVMEEVALVEDLAWPTIAPRPVVKRDKVSFVDDIYPLLCRIVDYSWVNEMALRGHGPGKRGYFLADDALLMLANQADQRGKQLRSRFKDVLRNPNLTGDEAIAQATYYYMPMLAGDEGDPVLGDPNTWLKLTKRQYETIMLWVDGNSDSYSSLPKLKEAIAFATPKPFEKHLLADQPFALTKAALTACVGGPFYPGIEMTSISKSKKLYSAAFELSDKLEAGDVTKWMALPWQADFYECNTHWWPAQRPDAVVSDFDFEDAVSSFDAERRQDVLATLLFPRKQWDRGVEVGRLPRPSFNWPVPDDGESTVDYATRAKAAYIKFTHANWSYRERSWHIPGPKDFETLPRYQFRLGDYFDRFSGKNGALGEQWHFPLPDATAGQDLDGYHQSVIDAFQVYIEGRFPTPEVGEDVDSFNTRLNADGTTWNQFLASTTQVGDERRQIYLGDNQMVTMWHEFGFVVPPTQTKERILIEKHRPRYDGLKDREYFYMMLNYNEFPGLEKKARQLVERFLNAAVAIQKTQAFKTDPDNRIYEFFKYSPAAFEARMQQIYNKDAADAAKADGSGWRKQDVLLRILQLAPFNQLDGAWLRYATDAGPITDINSLLFDIWSDETGGGNPALNHANLYTTLLQTEGIYLPDIRSRDYMENPALFDSAFTISLFELVISQFSRDYFPEILGMTMQLEWEVLTLWPVVKIFENNGVNAQFYRMHIGIDNADDGHGAKAKEAVQQYLDHVREEGGPDEVEKEWKRIWTGFVAFATTGSVGNDIQTAIQYPQGVEAQMIEMINRKKPMAQRNHGNGNLPLFGKKPLQNRLNDWFEDPQALLDELGNSYYITPGDPDGSYLLNDRLSYHGPMYKVFSEAEIKLWCDWVRWLGKAMEPRPGEPPDPSATMLQLIQRVAPIGSGVPAHAAKQLTAKVDGEAVTKSLAAWFDGDAATLMSALADPANGVFVPGDAAGSPFFANILPGAPGMQATLGGIAVDGQDGLTIIRNWVAAGCALPRTRLILSRKPQMPAVLPVGLQQTRKRLYRRQIFGMDAVH